MRSKTKKHVRRRGHKKTSKHGGMWPFSSSTASPALKPEVRGSNPPYLVYLNSSGIPVSKNDVLEGKYGQLPSLESLRTSNPTIYNTMKENRGDPSEEAGRWMSPSWTPKEQTERQIMGVQQSAFKQPPMSGLLTSGDIGPDGRTIPPPPSYPPPDNLDMEGRKIRSMGGKKKRKPQRSSSVRRRT